MAETVTQEPAQAVVEPAKAEVVAAPVIDVQAEIKKALEESDKKWQSRFDKVLTEKKTVETAKLSTEERIAKIEQEAKAKELNWARKEARAKATISEEMEAAIQLFHADDPEEIGKGAAEIRKLIDSETAPLKAKIEELEKSRRFGSPIPNGGTGASDGELASMKKQYDELMKAGRRDEANRLYVAMGQKRKP